MGRTPDSKTAGNSIENEPENQDLKD